MKIVISLVFVTALTLAGFSQNKPLTQSEYVRFLYSIEKDPAAKPDLIDALRKRGIAFQLTDGLRGLTRSKGRNDEELKRALEEAERRRRDPEGSRLPAPAELEGFVEKARTGALDAVAEMPDFVVKQLITRSAAFAGTGNWKPYSTLVLAVSYSSEKGEQYRLLVKDGSPVQDAVTMSSYGGLEGATSGGEFVEDLQKIFKPESKTRFELVTTDTVRGRRALVYDYEIDLENNKGRVGLKGPGGSIIDSSPAGERGRIWLDRETARVLRVEYNATRMAPSFAVKAMSKSIDYDMVDIAGEKYLLPIVSDFRGTVENGKERFENRNVIRFRSYQKYGTEVKVVEEDTEVPAEDQKPQP